MPTVTFAISKHFPNKSCKHIRKEFMGMKSIFVTFLGVQKSMGSGKICMPTKNAFTKSTGHKSSTEDTHVFLYPKVIIIDVFILTNQPVPFARTRSASILPLNLIFTKPKDITKRTKMESFATYARKHFHSEIHYCLI